MAPRILFVDQTGELGGGELMLLDLARHFRDRCAVVLLADGPLRDRLLAAGVATRVIAGSRGLLGVSRQGGRLRMIGSAPAVARTTWRIAAIARQFDLLYPNSQKAAVIAMLAGALARRPVVWHLHDILTAEHFGGLQRTVVVALSNRLARRVIANSQVTRDALIAAGGRPSQIGVVPNGLDPAPFDAVTDEQAAALRLTLGVPDVPLVGLFGRLAPWKGQHVLLEALPMLPGVHALLVGDALFGETEYRSTLARRAAELGVGDRVHWLGFRDDVAALMRAVDVVVHTSVSPEPFGRVIVEAMLARRPVLAAAGGAATEILGSDSSSSLVPPNDSTALGQAIERVLLMGECERTRLVAGHYSRAVSRYSLGGMTAGIEREIGMMARVDADPGFRSANQSTAAEEGYH